MFLADLEWTDDSRGWKVSEPFCLHGEWYVVHHNPSGSYDVFGRLPPDGVRTNGKRAVLVQVDALTVACFLQFTPEVTKCS